MDGSSQLLVAEFGRTGFRQEQFNWPCFLDADFTGNLVIADTGNHRVQILNAHDFKTMFPPWPAMGGCEIGQVLSPRSVKFCPGSITHSQIVVVDTGNCRVQFLRLVGDHLQMNGMFGDMLFSEPSDVTIDPMRGTIFVTDTAHNKLYIHDERGNVIGASKGSLSNPMGVAVDSFGRVFVADSGNDCLKVFNCNGELLDSVGGFKRPQGVAVDRLGRVYIADELNNRVVRYLPNHRKLETVIADIQRPKGVAAHNQIFVTTADPYNIVKVFHT